MSPCLQCGACCSAFRVSFYRGELLATEDPIPEDLVEEVTPFRVAMKGTLWASPRCVALEGVVGGPCRCTIYAQRPSPCHELQPSWQDGQVSEGCDRARVLNGMAPLTPADWMVPIVTETPRSQRVGQRQRYRRAPMPLHRRRLRRSRR